MPNCKTLLLVPTAYEADLLDHRRPNLSRYQLELCGFGPIVAAARTAALLHNYRPEFAVLVGIAGTYDQAAEIGTAVEFGQVACYGVGAGTGNGFVSAEDMGWKQWPHSPDVCDCLPLASEDCSPTLLTCCSASGQPNEAAQRKKRFPTAVAEDMEGFAVAVACRLAGVPLHIIRGISNYAGDRNHRNWQVESAMRSVSDLACAKLQD